jgi:hypothetical protein
LSNSFPRRFFCGRPRWNLPFIFWWFVRSQQRPVGGSVLA